MDFLRRAWISIWAKKSKTVILLILLLVIFSFIFAGFAIQDATTKSADAARKKLGGDVTLQEDQEKIMQKFQSGELSQDTEIGIPQKDINKINQLPQVKDYFTQSSGYATKGGLKQVKSESGSNGGSISTAKGSSGEEREPPSFKMEGINQFKLTAPFKDGTEKIIDGKPITKNDKGNLALIEEKLAKENNLKVGDKFKLNSTEKKESTFVVHGIYRNTEKQDPKLAGVKGAEFMLPPNKIYTTMGGITNYARSPLVSKAVFEMKDPKDIDSFKKEARKLTKVDDNELYRFDAQDDTYKTLIGPIERIASFSSVLVWLTLIAGGLILALIILLTIRERKFEMGILLSLGENKARLVGQFLVEVLLIATFSFIIACVIANPIGQAFSDKMLSNEVSKQESIQQSEKKPSPPGLAMSMNGEKEKEKQVDPISDINIDISSQVLLQVGLLGFLLIFTATLIPSFLLIRLQPKILFAQKD